MEPRFLNFVGATGKARKVTRDGRNWTVVPVIALVEGAIRAMNADDYELVPEECFRANAHEWDGAPLQPGHPLVDGRPVSASLPEFSALSFGHLEDTRVVKKQLRTNAWIDDEKAKANAKSARVLERVDANEMVEVSIGAYTALRPCEGEANGRKHKHAWAAIKPDHLAMLSDDQIGACSIAMGCGALRVNMMHADGSFEEMNETQFRAAYNPSQPRDENGQWTEGATVRIDPDGSLGHPLSKKVGTITQVAPSGKFFGVSRKGNFIGYFHQSNLKMTDLQARRDDEATDTIPLEIRAAMPAGWNDNDVRESLNAAVREKETGDGYSYIVAVYSDYVVYQLEERGPGPDYKYTSRTYSRGFTFDKETQKYTLGDERREREAVMTYEVVKAASGVQDSVPVDTMPPCGCGGHKPVTAASAAGENDMEKKERIAALVANPHNAVKSLKVLEAASDDDLKALEDAAAAAKKTADDLRVATEKATKAEADLRAAQEAGVKATADLAAVQTQLKALESAAQPLIDAEKAKVEAERTDLVGKLKALTAGFITEEELKAKPIGELRTLAAITKVNVPAAQAQPDFSIQGMPRFATTPASDIAAYAPPDPYASLTAAGK